MHLKCATCTKGRSVNGSRTSACGRYEAVSHRSIQYYILYDKPTDNFLLFFHSAQNIMEVMGFIAVLVNCALIGLSGQVHRLLPDMTAIQTVLLIVALEVG